jgi:hypothetical protein
MGNLTINSASLDLWHKSEGLNYGEINMENGSALTVHEHASIKISASGKVMLGPQSDVKVFTHAQIILCKNLSGEGQSLILRNESKLALTEDAKMILVRGQVTLLEKSHIDISEQGYLEVHGDVKLSKKSAIYIWKRAGIVIGSNHTSSKDNGKLSSTSLLFAKDEIRLYVDDECSLMLKPGVHCALKKTYYVKSAEILNGTTKNDYFDCYENKEQLVKALGKKPS